MGHGARRSPPSSVMANTLWVPVTLVDCGEHMEQIPPKRRTDVLRHQDWGLQVPHGTAATVPRRSISTAATRHEWTGGSNQAGWQHNDRTVAGHLDDSEPSKSIIFKGEDVKAWMTPKPNICARVGYRISWLLLR